MSTEKNEPTTDLELEQLLEGLSPEERELLLEEHRQLEKDLLRLADPLPPADFVHQVMQKVAAAPAPAPSAKDIALAVGITFAAFAAGVFAFVSHGAGFEGLALSLANLAVSAKLVLAGVGSAFEAVWRTAAVPVAVALGAMLVTSVFALKKLGTEARVAS